ncbi:hypothetical protein Tco_1413723, partial [Tanacetum coccineum]
VIITIGFGSPNKANSYSVNGPALGAKQVDHLTALTANAMSTDMDDMISGVTYEIKKGLIFLDATTVDDKL